MASCRGSTSARAVNASHTWASARRSSSSGMAALYIVSNVASAVGEAAYFVLLSLAEIALLLLLIRYA
jgi:hypothetical protein